MCDKNKIFSIKTSFHVWNVIVFDELASTNSYLQHHIEDYDYFTCIWTHNQTAGLGRLNRTWYASPKKDITMSLLVPLSHIPIRMQANITYAAALSVVQALRMYKVCPTIKWPNDVLINGKKVCGILSHVSQKYAFGEKKCPVAIVGIGVNIQSDMEDLYGISQMATSLFIETGKKYDRHIVLSQILHAMSHYIQSMKEGNFDILWQDIRACLSQKGKRARLLQDNLIHCGIVIDINDDGSLYFKCDTCGVMRVYSGEFSWDVKEDEARFCSRKT